LDILHLSTRLTQKCKCVTCEGALLPPVNKPTEAKYRKRGRADVARQIQGAVVGGLRLRAPTGWAWRACLPGVPRRH
jgi:hypothetical protein